MVLGGAGFDDVVLSPIYFLSVLVGLWGRRCRRLEQVNSFQAICSLLLDEKCFLQRTRLFVDILFQMRHGIARGRLVLLMRLEGAGAQVQSDFGDLIVAVGRDRV